MDELVATMMQSGFSVAVAAYLLVRMERRLEDLTLAIRELHGALLRGNAAGKDGPPLHADEFKIPFDDERYADVDTIKTAERYTHF